MRSVALASFVVFVLASAGPAPGQEEPPAGRVGMDVSYLSGGVGKEEREKLQAVAGNYDLKLVFSEGSSRSYVADVEVAVRSAAGEDLLRTKAEGPWLLVRVPDGRYTITAAAEGRRIERTVEVSGGQPKLVSFHWD